MTFQEQNDWIPPIDILSSMTISNPTKSHHHAHQVQITLAPPQQYIIFFLTTMPCKTHERTYYITAQYIAK
jgi:hypothetical protein